MSASEPMTYRTKNKLLAAGIALLALLSYLLAVDATLQAWSENRRLKSDAALAQNAPERLAALTGRLRELDAFLGRNTELAGNSGESLLDMVSDYCAKNRVVLSEFPAAVVDEQNDYRVGTYRIVVTGTFDGLAGLVHLLEKGRRGGRVASVSFYLQKDLKTKKHYLSATIFLQQLYMTT